MNQLNLRKKKYSKANPYQAEVLENINLNGRGSNKETRHIEFLLDNFGEEYEVGDCLVVLPQNDPALVELLMSTLGWDPEIKFKSQKMEIRFL